MTRRDLFVALVTAGAVYAATMYGGPLAGKAAKVVVPAVVDRVADRIIEQKPLEEPPVWTVTGDGVTGTVVDVGQTYTWTPKTRWCRDPKSGKLIASEECQKDEAKGRKRRITAPAPLDLDYYRALHREGLFPVTTHEAR